MAANKEQITLTVWRSKRDSSDDPDVLEGDWRDPDLSQRLDGLTMYSNDLDYQESHSKAEPDWSKGCEARTSENRTVIKFDGRPPYPFDQALLQGRLLYGCVIARDLQRHNR